MKHPLSTARDRTEHPGVPPDPEREDFAVLADTVRDYAIFLLDASGHVRTWNEGARQIKGYEGHEIIGRHFSAFYTTEDLARNWPARELEIALEQGRLEDEGWRVRKDGTTFWASVVITALRDPHGVPRGFLKITRDLTERKRQEEGLRQSEERFRVLVNGVSDYAIILLDPAGTVASWNEGAQRINGYTPEEIIGRHFSVFYPPEMAGRGMPDDELRIAVREGRFEDEGWRVRKDGTRFWANVVVTPLYREDGSLRGYAKVSRDMTERKRIERLEEEGRRTNEFLAMLGHELRNPLAPIRNALAIMRSPGADGRELEWSRDVIDRQVVHLSRLVDDLLDVSRITRGIIRLERERLDLGAIVRGVVDSSSHAVSERGHTLELSLPAERVYVEGDSTRLAQVVLNLLTNAIKFTPPGGRVEIVVEPVRDYAIVRVRDTGIGITPELRPRIFDLFTQGDHSIDRNESGLGIGLTLVRRLVEMHGGSVDVFSAGAGRGSEFVVRLPALTARPTSPAPSKVPESPAAPRRRVLVVDDNRDSAESLAMMLSTGGHEVQVAFDGAQALEKVAAFDPRIVILDIGLPIMSGYEVAEKIRAMPSHADAVLVAMTGYGGDEDQERSQRAGFDVHLVKPVDPQMFDQILRDPRNAHEVKRPRVSGAP